MPFHEWPAPFIWFAALLTALLLVDAIRRAGWHDATTARAGADTAPGDAGDREPVPAALVWVLATLTVLALRQMTVTMPGGLTLQYLGAAWLTLLLGYPRAVTSIAAVYLVEFVSATGPHAQQVGVSTQALGAFVLPLLLLGIAPAWMIWSIAAACRRWLPPNLFVFLLGVGFFGLQLAYALPLVAAAALTALFGGASAPDYWQTMLPFALLLVAGEAWLEGIMVTLLVVFAPRWVRLFDEGHYLPH